MTDLALSIKPGDTVWLVPNTITAPPICYTNASGVVADVDGLYLVVSVPGKAGVRVHVDNVRRTDPTRRERPARKPTPHRPLPDGFTEVTLW